MTQLTIPDHLKGVNVGSDVDAAAASSMSVPRISLRGRTFRFIENGEEIRKVNESINVVILGVEPQGPRMMKTFYEKGYSPGSTEPPTCASHDGIAPSPWVSNPQSPKCDTCPMNKFGSSTSPSGKASKRCRDSKMLIVSHLGDKSISDATQYSLSVTVNSLRALSEYARLLKSHNLPFQSVITKVEMVDAEYPQIKFAIDSFMSKEQFEAASVITEARPWSANVATALPAPEVNSRPALPAAIPDHLKTQTSEPKPISAGDPLNNW